VAQHLEELEQQAVVDWAAFKGTRHGPLVRFMFAIPNGAHLAGDTAKRSFQMARLKKTGLRKGAGDLLVMIACGGWHGLFVEMKKRRDQFRSAAEAAAAVSREQREFAVDAKAAGYAHAVCYGFEEARARIESYLEGRDVVMEEGT
jgi:hypothetical protein